MISVVIFNLAIIGIAVMIHYEFLYRITLLLPRMHIRYRLRILIGVFLALAAHVVQVWLFALSFFFMHNAQGWGHLQGNFDGSLLDCVYFSFTTYTTLGTGDIQPLGDLRFLTGLESLTGLVMITWTASFLYLEMRRYWNEE